MRSVIFIYKHKIINYTCQTYVTSAPREYQCVTRRVRRVIAILGTISFDIQSNNKRSERSSQIYRMIPTDKNTCHATRDDTGSKSTFLSSGCNGCVIRWLIGYRVAYYCMVHVTVSRTREKQICANVASRSAPGCKKQARHRHANWTALLVYNTTLLRHAASLTSARSFWTSLPGRPRSRQQWWWRSSCRGRSPRWPWGRPGILRCGCCDVLPASWPARPATWTWSSASIRPPSPPRRFRWAQCRGGPPLPVVALGIHRSSQSWWTASSAVGSISSATWGSDRPRLALGSSSVWHWAPRWSPPSTRRRWS